MEIFTLINGNRGGRREKTTDIKHHQRKQYIKPLGKSRPRARERHCPLPQGSSSLLSRVFLRKGSQRPTSHPRFPKSKQLGGTGTVALGTE